MNLERILHYSRNKKENGFTLVELIIVVALISLLAGLSIPSFNNFTRNQNLKQAEKKLKTDLRSAQTRALNGVLRDDKDGWGVSFTVGNDYYTLCGYDRGAGTCGAISNSDPFPEGIEIISSTNPYVAFEMIVGTVINPGTTITIGYSGGSTVSLQVDDAGNVE